MNAKLNQQNHHFYSIRIVGDFLYIVKVTNYHTIVYFIDSKNKLYYEDASTGYNEIRTEQDQSKNNFEKVYDS